MRKVTTLFCTLVLLTSVFSMKSFAQEQQDDEINKKKNNWFISLGGTGNLLLGEQDSEASIQDRIAFGGAFSVGKWFSPYLGARVQVMGGQLKGFNFFDSHTRQGEYVHPGGGRHDFPFGYKGSANDYSNPNNWSNFDLNDDKNGFYQKFNYGTVGLDIMTNLTNLFRGVHHEKNKFEFIPFVGAGFIHAFKNDETTPNYNGFFAKVGFMANYNINSQWSVFLEPQANLTPSQFDGYIGHSDGDAIVNLTLGVQYTINRDFTTPNASVLSNDEVDYLNRRINENRTLIDNHQNILERQQKLLKDLGDCCDERETVVIDKTKKYLPDYIRFSLNSSEIFNGEQAKIKDAVEYLKANPDSKLLLIGYADKRTGNSNYNLNLSKKRVETVANALKGAGISSNRLILEWKGDKEQPYQNNDWNRVVIMVERR